MNVLERMRHNDPSLGLLARDRPFRYYWFGQTVSGVGSQMTVFVLPLVTALALDGSPGDVGLVATTAMAPYLLFSMLAGHTLEGRNKRSIMIGSDLAQALLLGSIPVAWALDLLSVPLLAVVAFLSGTAALMFGLVGFSYVPDLVPEEELGAANRAIQGSRTFAQISAPGIGGILVGAMGPALALVIDALSYLASALGIGAAQPSRQIDETHTTGQGTSVWDGLCLLFASPLLRPLTVHAALYNFASQIFTLNLVLWAVQRQQVSVSAYGVAIGFGGVGALFGTFIALRIADRLGIGRAFIASLVLSCVVPLLTTVWALTGLALAVVIAVVMLVSGIGLGNANIYSITMRQSMIPRDQLTRSAGAYSQVMYGAIPLGAASAGLLGEILGTRTAATIGAAILALSMLPMITRSVLSFHVAKAPQPVEARS
ncbi:MFS transporter [Nocardioides bruguierae]|uniref:MFS transporter n=1 Tax=Nocardioides bruguierae TaxID=2945102 RepID=A0A9X2DEE2_9ACTN|nr:MFS transporter [Nocardioides bruguierae]MCM0622859.1 MFS transporter [Nocardioides bruguierae]